MDKNGFFDLASYLDPSSLAQLSEEERSGLFGYLADDVKQVSRHLGRLSSICGDKKMFVLEIEVDKERPEDNKFQVFFNDNKIIEKGPFDKAITMRVGVCLTYGEVRVVVTDLSKDGMKEGSFTVKLDDVVVPDDSSGEWSEHELTFNTDWSAPTPPTLPPSPRPTEAPNTDITGRNNTCFEPRTDEEEDYLLEHNNRREIYHDHHGAEYKPLQWSNDLADKSAAYATELLQYCCTGTLVHDPKNAGKHGENLASNCGRNSWGEKPEAYNILNRWVNNEHSESDYKKKLHYTQALWRGTEHVGCGVAERVMDDGRTCHTQVCRYQKPGNCGVNQSNYLEKTLADTSRCNGVPVSC